MSTNAKVTSLGVLFDASQVAPQQAAEAIPAGWYSVVISDGEITVNDGGAGRRMKLEFTVTEGPFKGRKIWDGLNIIHSSAQAQQIAAGQLSAICHAISVFQVQDVQQLFNKPFQIKVDLEGERFVNANNEAVDPNTPNAKRYEPRNNFKAAKAGSAPVSVATTAPGAPGAPAPAWAANAPAPAATVPPVSAPPAWGAQPGVVTPPPVTPAPAAATPPPATPAAPAKTKGKPGPKPKAKPPEERKFYVGLEGDAYANPIAESVIAAWLAKGMPADTALCLDGEEDWKTPAEYGIGAVAAAPAAPAPVTPPPAAVVPPVAAPGAGDPPPWGA